MFSPKNSLAVLSDAVRHVLVAPGAATPLVTDVDRASLGVASAELRPPAGHTIRRPSGAPAVVTLLGSNAHHPVLGVLSTELSLFT